MWRTVLGVLAASIAIYLWGFLYWGAVGVQTWVWKNPVDGAAAQRALSEIFPEEGTYYVPSPGQPDWEKHMSTGPLAFVHMIDRDGRPIVDPSIMLKGFILYLVTVAVLALMMRAALPALPTYGSRVYFVALAGLVSMLLVDIGEHVWWVLPFRWKLVQGVYNFGAWLLAGAVLAFFVRPEATPPS
ncbi:MAG: hypothetical protein HUU46_04890 [Candidatus Hydrogenedentes bacterium]|nr:hypothetical protein [Candidatus Hydrogenedentota bacterium]